MQIFGEKFGDCKYRYIESVRHMRSLFDTSRDDGYRDGIAEGRAEGRAEGSQSRALDIARNLKGMGFDVDQIMKATGLGMQEIEEL